MAKLKLGFMASHGGSNMQAILDAIKDERLDALPLVIISNNSSSMALTRAEKEGIPHYHVSAVTYPDINLDDVILDIFDKHGVEIVILAGYMKKLGRKILDRYKGRVLNIHPALLPKFGGKGMYGIHVHEAVIAAGEALSGATIHTVDEVYDRGRILAQKTVPVIPGDTPESLADRVLKIEHIIYTETLQKIAAGEIEL